MNQTFGRKQITFIAFLEQQENSPNRSVSITKFQDRMPQTPLVRHSLMPVIKRYSYFLLNYFRHFLHYLPNLWAHPDLLKRSEVLYMEYLLLGLTKCFDVY